MASHPDVPWLDPGIAAYVAARTEQPDPIEQALITETATLGGISVMQIAPHQGALMRLLVRLVGARTAVEVGTFTGSSSLSIARALPADGHLLCLDVSDEWTAVARRYWAEAGVEDKIELRLGPAIDSLRALPRDEAVDLAFIDADKPGYLAYLDELVPRVRAGGLIMVDNTLWSGAVIDPAADDRDTAALKVFNDAVAADPRLESYLLPIADGLTLIRKR